MTFNFNILTSVRFSWLNYHLMEHFTLSWLTNVFLFLRFLIYNRIENNFFTL